MSWPKQPKPAEQIHGDRRYDRRYDLALELRWKLVRRRKVLDSGVGATIDLSSGGILFEGGRQLPIGMNVELEITWPALLHDVAPMQLFVSGRIVRTQGTRIGIHMTQHEFRAADTHGENGLSTDLRAASAILEAPALMKFEVIQ